jgi:dihydroorotase
MAAMTATPLDTLTITRPDDWHLHVRDGEPLATVVPHTAAQFGRAIIMPNLRPPVTTAAQAMAYKQRILAAVPPGVHFEPLMTLYLTDNLAPDEIARAKDAGVVALKLYPAGATTNSDAGVTDIRKTYKTLEAMQKAGILLLVHGEVTGSDIDLFDREAVFIDQHLIPLRRDFPELKIVFEHITTKEAAQYVAQAGRFTAATITAHQRHLHRRHPPALLLPARAQARDAPPGAGAGRHQRQRPLLPRHRQRAAPRAPQGARHGLRGLLYRARGHRDVCRGFRQRGRARPA